MRSVTIENLSTLPVGERAVLVCPNRGVGREVLRALALGGGGWLGLEIATPESLASDVVATDLAREGLAPLDELDRRALVDEALDAALEAEDPARFGELREGVGFRDAVANAVEALRLAGVGPGALRAADLEDTGKRDALADVLERYEAGLAAARGVDVADAFRRAIAAVEGGAEAAPGARILLMPELRTRGLAGRFVGALAAGGASVLAGAAPSPLAFLHAVADAPPPTAGDPVLDLVAAGSPTDELREALRRALAAGARWDEVEIVATDPVAYGSALDTLATRLEIPVTYAVGLPIGRTRQGRAAMAWLTWIQEDFPADILRQLLESGDVRPPDDEGPWSGRLARRLRRLRVGWGRARYQDTIARALNALDEAPPLPDDDPRPPEEIAERRTRERAELETLRDLVAAILDATPPVPDRLGRGAARVAPAALAEGLRAFLAFVPHPTPVEAEAHARLVERLERIAERLTRETSFGSALAILRSHLDLRVPSPGAEGPLPWSSAGGALHFADLDHGGWTGRRLTFVVGLDAERFPGAGIQDPILLDADRERLDPGALPSAVERLAERRWALAALLARLGGGRGGAAPGRVTLSYSAWTASEGRAVAPAADLLQALRLRERDPALDYEAFHAAVSPVACAVPRGAARLDDADVWLGALEDPADGILLAGLPAVRAVFPFLDRGLAARAARESDAFTTWDGRVEPRPDRLDPRACDRVQSNTALETLGACPLRYFYQRVLGVWKPDDPALDPGAWLEPRHRGTLLHDVYEIALGRARERGIDLADDAFGDLAGRVLAERVERFRGEVPVPSEVVFRREVAALEADVRSFVRMVRERPPAWLDLERRFGYGRGGDPVELSIPGGRLRVSGRIDRVDEEDAGLVVVDYKTGKTYGYGAATGTWSGGRRLQHLIYARVARLLYGREVTRMEFWFPTARGENHRAAYPVAALGDGDEVLGALCDTLAAGWFVPTDDPSDCKFCDYQKVCRVNAENWNDVESPPAEWGKAHSGLDEYRHLRLLRSLG